MTAPTQIDAGHPSLHWPADTDKDALRASMRKGYPNATDAQIERLAKAGGMIDALCGKRMYAAREASFDGRIVSPVVADELRGLGRRLAA